MKDFQKSATWDAEHRLLFCTSTGFITCTTKTLLGLFASPLFAGTYILLQPPPGNTISSLPLTPHRCITKNLNKGLPDELMETAHSWIFTMFFLIHFCQSIYHDSTGFISLCQSTCRYLHLVHLRQVHQQQAKSTSKCRSKSSRPKPFKEASLQ